MSRRLAKLEDLCRQHINFIRVKNIILVDDMHVPKMAAMIAGHLEQDESVEEAVTRTVNFYASHYQTNAEGEGMPELTAAVDAWSKAEVSEPSSDEHSRLRDRVRSELKELYESMYGDDDDNWLEVNTNNYDADPVMYLETIAMRFNVPMPPYMSNADLVEYILARTTS